MLKNEYVFYNSLFIIGIIIFCFNILVIDKIEPIWNNFADPLDYLHQAKMDVFNSSFFAPIPTDCFSPRPFTVPLFYKLVDAEPYKIIMFQKLIHCICSVLFSFIFVSFIQSKFIKVISFYLLLFLFCWLNIVGWTNNLLSESISNSLLFLWLDLYMLFVAKNSTLITILFCFTCILFSFTRDSWPYVIVMALFISTIQSYFYTKQNFKKNIFVLVFSITLFFVQGYTSKVGERHKLPIFNTVVGRISKNDAYLKWFEQNRMPISNSVKSDFSNIDVDKNKAFIYSKYQDPNYLPLMEWSAKNGKSIYQLFLLTHPSYFFLSDQTSIQVNRMFCYNIGGYFKQASKSRDYTDSTFPLWNLATTFLLVITLLFISIYLKTILYSIPSVIAILGAFNALIIYNADTMEVERHLYITQVLIQLLNITCFCFLVDIFIQYLNKKKWHLKFIPKRAIKD